MCHDRVKRLKKIIILTTEDWYFYSHRIELAKYVLEQGYQVIVVTRVNLHYEKIFKEGIKILPIDIERRGGGLLKGIYTIWQLSRIYKREKPDIVHHVSHVPIVYGTIAAYLSRTQRVVNAFTGMGSMFISGSIKAKIFRSFIVNFYKAILNRRYHISIVQNEDDYQYLHKSIGLAQDKLQLIKGVGVNTEQYAFNEEPKGVPTIVLASRMLLDKGVREFVLAARKVLDEGLKAKFVLAGMIDKDNPSAISEREIVDWCRSGVVTWLGHVDNIEELFRDSHIVCLPSYREGLPKVLLEAAACARPIIATNVPGCREVVINGVNGILVPPRSVDELSQAMNVLVSNKELRLNMGRQGRKLIEEQFSLKKINGQTLDVYANLMKC